jgi:hypothetical protein
MFKGYFYLFCAFMTIVFMYLSIQTTSAETNTVSSTVVNNTPPTANAPVIPNSNSDICKVGIVLNYVSFSSYPAASSPTA